uniref:F-box domain-containing protein n=1 Tax=Oryza barthii TaxID=65489 RepID=A0A0D3HAT2_9ORYZ
MEGRSCRRRKVKTPAHAAGMDWISDLPDEILHRIMSLLNARQAVQTCVLSRRWRNLWRTVPCINADCKEFDFFGFRRSEVEFKRFVNRLLELRDPIAMMDAFWFRYHKLDIDTASSADANRWISHALQKQARVLEVVMYPWHQLELDHSRFTSRYLRKIGFSGVRLDQGFFKQLEAGCPALEDLFLHHCTIEDDKISSQTLKVLTIDRTYFSIAINASEVQKKSISAPSLKIENNLQWCPEFVNVVNLTLGKWCLDANFYALTVFLQNSPKLQKLTLKLAKCTSEIHQRIIGELTERSFTCEHLKIIEVICLENDPQVIRVKDFFASSGITSVQFHIKHWSQLKEDDNTWHREREAKGRERKSASRSPQSPFHSMVASFIREEHRMIRSPVAGSIPLTSPLEVWLISSPPTRATCSTKRRGVLGSHMEDDTAGWDRLSDLPEGVLHRIMSFLNMCQAVRTCVLSRRWRNFWRTVPYINADINEFDFYYGDNGNSDEEFRLIVNRLLELRDPTVVMDIFWL